MTAQEVVLVKVKWETYSEEFIEDTFEALRRSRRLVKMFMSDQDIMDIGLWKKAENLYNSQRRVGDAFWVALSESKKEIWLEKFLTICWAKFSP